LKTLVCLYIVPLSGSVFADSLHFKQWQRHYHESGSAEKSTTKHQRNKTWPKKKKTFDADVIEVNQRRKFLQISTDLKRIRKSIIYKTNLNSIIYTSLYFSDVLYYSYRSNPRYLNCVTCGMIWPLTVTFKLEKCFILC
jgi:hypothetical protein